MRRLGKMSYVVMLFLISGGALSASGQEAKKTYAQKLVDDTLAKHKEVVIMAMHVTPPGKNENVIIASNIGRIGKKADEDDLRVIETGKPNLEVNKKGAITLKSSWCSRINPARQLVRSGLSSCTKRGKKRSSRKRPNRSARR